MTRRDDDWVRPSKTRADLRDHVERLARADRLDVDVPPGTVRVARRGSEWAVTQLGAGGGFAWRRRMDTRELLAYLRQWRDREQFDEIQLRHVEAEA